jgi:hypothetical protein
MIRIMISNNHFFLKTTRRHPLRSKVISRKLGFKLQFLRLSLIRVPKFSIISPSKEALNDLVLTCLVFEFPGYLKLLLLKNVMISDSRDVAALLKALLIDFCLSWT